MKDKFLQIETIFTSIMCFLNIFNKSFLRMIWKFWVKFPKKRQCICKTRNQFTKMVPQIDVLEMVIQYNALKSLVLWAIKVIPLPMVIRKSMKSSKAFIGWTFCRFIMMCHNICCLIKM